MPAKPATARKRKLKVFRTPIGFHDAYVAAPSRKAALEAWGADSDLFAQGIAEEVSEPSLTRPALERPGEVVKVARGSAAEHVAALAGPAGRRRRSPSTGSAGPPQEREERVPKQSRGEVAEAEAALDEAGRRHKAELRAIDREMDALERRRRDLIRRNEAERDELTERRNRARIAYDRAIRAWEKR